MRALAPAANDERFVGAINHALHEQHKRRLTRKQVLTGGAVLLGCILLGEGGVAFHYWSHGQVAEGLLIVTSWFRDIASEMVRSVIEDA